MGLRRFVSNLLFSRRTKKEIKSLELITIKRSVALGLENILFSPLNSEFSTNGKLILTYEVDAVGGPIIWMVDGKVITYELKNKFKPFNKLHNAQFHPDCSKILTSSTFVDKRRSYEQEKLRNKVCLWSMDGTLIHVFAEQKYPIPSSLSMDGKMLMALTECRRRSLDIFSIEKLELIQSISGKIRCASFSYDSKKVLIQQNNKIHISSCNQHLDLVTIEYNYRYSPKLSQNSQLIILHGERNNSVDIYCANTGKKINQYTGKVNDFVSSMCFSPDNKFIAVGYGNGSIRIWSTYNGELINFFNPLYGVVPHNPVSSITFNKDVTMFVACYGYLEKPMLWDTKTWRLLALLENNGGLKNNRGKVSSVQFSPDGKSILSTRGIACIWRIDDSRIYP